MFCLKNLALTKASLPRKRCVSHTSILSALASSIMPKFYAFGKRQSSNFTTASDTNRDVRLPPGDLMQCGDSTLFFVWRPKEDQRRDSSALALEGWTVSDPQGLFQRAEA